MKQNKILWFVIVVLLLISVSLSFLCYHLIKNQNEAAQDERQVMLEMLRLLKAQRGKG